MARLQKGDTVIATDAPGSVTLTVPSAGFEEQMAVAARVCENVRAGD